MAVAPKDLPFDFEAFERAEAARLEQKKEAIMHVLGHTQLNLSVWQWRYGQSPFDRLKRLPVRINHHLAVLP